MACPRFYSICEEPGAWWLQLALEGDPEYTVTFRASLHETAPETLARLSRWLSDLLGRVGSPQAHVQLLGEHANMGLEAETAVTTRNRV